jgi:hypothetical protein
MDDLFKQCILAESMGYTHIQKQTRKIKPNENKKAENKL